MLVPTEFSKIRFEGVIFNFAYLTFKNDEEHQKKLFGKTLGEIIYFQEPHCYWISQATKKYSSFGEFILKKFVEKPEFYSWFKKECAKCFSEFENLFSKADENEMSLLSDKTMLNYYDKLNSLVGYTFSLVFPPCEGIGFVIENKIRAELKKIKGLSDKELLKSLNLALMPSWKSYVKEEEEELFKIIKRIKTDKEIFRLFREKPEPKIMRELEKHKSINTQIDKYIVKHCFAFNSYKNIEKADKSFFIKRIKNMLSEAEPEQIFIKWAEKEKKLKKIGVSKALLTLVRILDETGKLHDQRKSLMNRSAYLFNRFLREIARRKGVRSEDILFFTPQEIRNLMQNKLGKKEITVLTDKRRTCIVIFSKKRINILYGEKAKSFKKEFFAVKQDEGMLKGAGASQGKAAGKAKIILNLTESDSFKEGEVLVTNHTTPDWIVLMKKTSAIVTERGGITSHAAIVSRELGIPCVVGIKNVTALLKDGEVIEVDADRGIVKKIESIHTKEKFPEELIANLSPFCTRPETMQRDIIAAVLFYKFKNARLVSLPLDKKSRTLLVEKQGRDAAYRAALKSVDTEQKWRRHLSDYKRITKNFISASEMLTHDDSNKHLKEYFEKFWLALDRFTIFLLMPFAIEEFVDNELRKNVPEDVLFAASFPSELNEYQKMRLDIIEAKLKNKYSPKQLAEKYGWYNEYSYLEPLLDEKHFRQKISELTKEQAEQEKKKILELIIINRKEFPKAIKKIKDKKIRLLAEIIHTYTFIRAERLDTLKKAQVNARHLFRRIAEQAGIMYELVPTLTTEEILGFLDGKELPPLDELEKRARHEYIFYQDSRVHIIYDHVEEITKRILDFHKKDDIRGLIAFKGIARGHAKIILSKQDLIKVNEGDILVAKTTMPDYTPAMRKAAAIVTDDGGITSHAAIVSRELKKPCIVGTVNATAMIKDGDLAEVDANKGVVRKISEKEFHDWIKALEKEEASIEVSRIPSEKLELEIRPDLVTWFKDINKKDLPLAGGKGANLGEMFNKFPVPNGFCITVNAYKKFLKENALEEKIFPLLVKLDIEKTAELDAESKRIQDLIVKSNIPLDVEKEILANYRQMGDKFVAVRSSATAEDLPTASFAGQQATFLNVKGEEDLLKAVKECWASLFTARAIYYRVINKFHHEKVLISVVLQEMVNSAKAGVMFTANPVTNDRNEIIIEGSYGLGESVVSGSVTPDNYLVQKNPFRIKEINVNEKNTALYRDAKTGANIKIDLDKAKANSQCLAEKEIKELAELGMRIEKHYGKPQDIEWAVGDDDKLYILQSRPITTLIKESKPLADKFIELAQGQELYPPVSSMMIFAPRISGHISEGYYKDMTSQPYLTLMKKDEEPFVFSTETKFRNSAREWFINYWKSPGFLLKEIKKMNECLKEIDKLYSTCTYEFIRKSDFDELASKAREVIAVNRKLTTLMWFIVYSNPEFYQMLLQEFGASISKERFKEIWPKATNPAFESFEKTRYQEVLELIGKKTSWLDMAEACQYFFANYNEIKSLDFVKRELHKKYGRISPRETGYLIRKTKSEMRETAEAHKKFLKSLNPDEKKLAFYLQESMRFRDVRKNGVSKALMMAYRIAQRMFQEAGISEDLIRYCSCDEIPLGIDYIKKNKANIRKRSQGIVMLFITDKDSDVEFEYGTYDETKNKLLRYYDEQLLKNQKNFVEIKGQVGCAGKAQGRARIVYQPSTIKDFRKGDVLVTSMTRPEFVPLMKRASAIVTSEGGVTSHAAIVARELNKPCVVGTRIATRVIKDGDFVEVDADHGVVRKLK